MLGQRADAVAVEWHALTDLGEQLAGAAHLAGFGVLQHQHEQLVAGLIGFGAAERLGAALQLGEQRRLFGRQVGETAAGQLGHFIEGLQIAFVGGADDEAHAWPRSAMRRMVTADSAARSGRLSAMRNSSVEWIAPPRAPIVSTTGTPHAAMLLPSHTPPVSRQPMSRPRSAPRLLDQPEQLFGAGVDRLGRAVEAAMDIDADVMLGGDGRHRGVDLGLGAGDLGLRGGAEIDAEHGEIGHDIVRPAAFDARRIDRELRPPGLAQSQREIGRGDDGVAAVLRIAPGMRASAAHDDREIARAAARARQRAVGQRGFIGQRRDLAARRLASSAAEEKEPVSSSELITTS